MVRFILMLSLLLSFQVQADFLGIKTDESTKSKIADLTAKLKALDMTSNPSYEDSFNQLVKSIESSMDDEKLRCSGEIPDASGKVLAKEQKQLCFRELKENYLEALDVIFDLKKKYLELIHNRQVERLSNIQKKLKSDIEKSF